MPLVATMAENGATMKKVMSFHYKAQATQIGVWAGQVSSFGG